MPKQELPEVSASDGALQLDEHLEWLLMVSCVHNYAIYSKLKDYICPVLSGSQTTSEKLYRKDFIEPIYNELWPVVCRYWKTLSSTAMASRRGQMWPGLWKQALFPPGAFRHEVQENHLWTELSKLLDEKGTPLDMNSLQMLTQSSSFLKWRIAAATREGHHNIVRVMDSTQQYNPETIEQAAREIQAAGKLEMISFQEQVHHVLMGDRPVKGMSIPTGIDEIDTEFFGGWPADAMILMGGFTGGGKTVAAVQMGLEAINVGIPTLLITTEITIPAYLTRMVSNHLNCNYGEIQKWQIQNRKNNGHVLSHRYFPPSITEHAERTAKLTQLEKDIGSYLRVEDWSLKPNASIEDSLIPQIEMLIASGFVPQYLIFDWLSPSVIKTGRNQAEWQGYERAAEAFTKVLKRFQMAGILFAQLADHSGSDKLAYPREHHFSHSKRMANFMSFVVCISRLTSRELGGNTLAKGGVAAYAQTQYWNIPKNRDFPPKHYKVVTRFDVQKFESA